MRDYPLAVRRQRWVNSVMRHLRVLAGTGIVVALLAGCTPVAPVAEPTVKPTINSSATASPTPTASAAPTKPELADLVLSTAGLGPLLMGAVPPVTDPALDILVLGEVTCDPSAAPIPDVWIANYPDITMSDGKMTSPFQVAVKEGGLVARIDVRGSGIHTDRGIQIGSTTDDVLAAYPDASEIVDFTRALVYAMRGSTGTLLIEIDTSDDGDGRPYGTVVSMRVGAPDVPVYAVSNTGNVISPCNLG